MRKLHSHGDGQQVKDDFQGLIVENYRPPQALNERSVRCSFENSGSD